MNGSAMNFRSRERCLGHYCTGAGAQALESVQKERKVIYVIIYCKTYIPQYGPSKLVQKNVYYYGSDTNLLTEKQNRETP